MVLFKAITDEMICYNWEEKKQIPPVPYPSLFSSFPASHFLAVTERRETAPFPFAHFCPSEKWATSRQLFIPWSYALCGWLGVENQLLTSHYCVFCFRCFRICLVVPEFSSEFLLRWGTELITSLIHITDHTVWSGTGLWSMGHCYFVC